MARLVVSLALLVGAVGCSGPEHPASTAAVSASPAADTSTMYVVELDGTARAADITLDEGQGTSQFTGIPVPLADPKTHAAGLTGHAAPGTRIYFSAQNAGDSGSLHCRISAGGRVIAENVSSGGYTIVECQAVIP